MKFTVFSIAFLTAAVSARDFTLYDDANYGGASNRETRNNDNACWNLNGKGDRASSVRGGSGCTTFYRERDCTGSNWQQRGDAATVPDFLNDHIWSFRNQCPCSDPFSVCQFQEGDGDCTTGYEGCIKKMGCNVCPGGEAGCIGCALGCLTVNCP